MSQHALTETLDLRAAVRIGRPVGGSWSPDSRSGLATGASALVTLVPIGALAKDQTAADHYLQPTNTFVTTLAHEIRQPLSALRSAIQALRLEHRSELSDRIRDVMTRQINQMDRLVEDILDATRLSRGKVTLRRQRIDARDVIRDAVVDVMPDVSSRHHTLAVFAGDSPLWLDADPQRLLQVLSNLLGNAVKYTRPGGRITLTADGHGSTLTICLSDTGRGIAPDILPHIFDLFVQAEPGDLGGLGVGLSVVQEIVALHEGHIQARSAGVNFGSQFVVTLPLALPFVDHSSAEVPLLHLAVARPLIAPSLTAFCCP